MDLDRKVLVGLMALFFVVIYPGVIIYTAHKLEQRSRARLHRSEQRSRAHSNYISCRRYNSLVDVVDNFHVTVKIFLQQARRARVDEANALKDSKSPVVKKIVKVDRLAAKRYARLISNIYTTPLDPSCIQRRAK